MKSLIFDYDKSLSTIGSLEKITETFGVPSVRVEGGVSTVRGYLGKILKKNSQKVEHELFGEVVEEKLVFSDKAQSLGLGILAHDTLTALGLQERGEIRKKAAPKKNGIPQKPYPSMKLQQWGEYGDTMNDLVYSLTNVDGVVIMNAHVDREQTATGDPVEYPAMKGSAKNEIQKWFDIILFAYVETMKENGKTVRKFLWQTKPTDGRFAKDRKNVLDDIMEQDYTELLGKYWKEGVEFPKILVLGESGSGKTYALQTLEHTKLEQLHNNIFKQKSKE